MTVLCLARSGPQDSVLPGSGPQDCLISALSRGRNDAMYTASALLEFTGFFRWISDSLCYIEKNTFWKYLIKTRKKGQKICTVYLYSTKAGQLTTVCKGHMKGLTLIRLIIKKTLMKMHTPYDMCCAASFKRFDCYVSVVMLWFSHCNFMSKMLE